MAALWSAYPEKTAPQILEAVFASADQAGKPDNERGYGLPDFTDAWLRLGHFNPYAPAGRPQHFFSFDRFGGELKVLVFNNYYAETDECVLLDANGKAMRFDQLEIRRGLISTITLGGLYDLSPGTYQVVLRNAKRVDRYPVSVWR